MIFLPPLFGTVHKISAGGPTRLYLQNAAAPYNTATERGAWDTVAAFTAIKLGNAPAGVAATRANAETNATNNWDILQLKAVTDALPSGGTLSGTVEWILGAVENGLSANAHIHVHIFVTVGDSDVVRGTALSDFISPTEHPTTAQGVGDGAQSLTSVAYQAGDRIVVEIGSQMQNTTTASMSSTLNYGNTGGTDLTLGSTNVTTEPGWFEFSASLGL